MKKIIISILALLLAATGTMAQNTYTVTVKDGTADAEKWTADPNPAAAGQQVKVTYTGTKMVKSVKARVVMTDLSMLDCAGNKRANRWTANCYMVHTAGYYKLPLVYGNAIKNGADNTVAYNPGGTTNDTYCANFVNHAGNAITAPWIKDNGITVASAELLWQDAQGLITKVGISGDYLTLTVGKNATTQEGNALVAAKDASGNIVWSWHIWVTKQTFADLTTVNTGEKGHTYQVTPVNIGWVGDAVSQGYHTYYQWGRKDAFIPSTGTDNTNHTVYDINDTEVTNPIICSTDEVGIDGNIKNPTTFYTNEAKKPYNVSYYNLWDAQQTYYNDNIATATKKTVYDPCPAGFCVPTGNLYYYIKNGGVSFAWDDTNKGRSMTINSNSVFFPASGYFQDNFLSVASWGGYWSASAGTPNNYAQQLYFSSDYLWWLNAYRSFAHAVRAVAEE